MYGSHSTVTVCHSNPHFTISVHTVTNTYGCHSCYSIVPVLLYSYCKPIETSLSYYQCTLLPICTVATVELLYAIPILTVTISGHTVTNMYGSRGCYSIGPGFLYSYCKPNESSLSLYQCTLLPICTVSTGQLLYAIPILTSLYQCTQLPIRTVATVVTALCQYCCTVTVSQSNFRCHITSAHF